MDVPQLDYNVIFSLYQTQCPYAGKGLAEKWFSQPKIQTYSTKVVTTSPLQIKTDPEAVTFQTKLRMAPAVEKNVIIRVSFSLTLLIVKSMPGLPEQTPVKQYLSLQ